ncbi:hypothetical protein E2C01_095216 [Portunus trituberculatus]|uniref:Uncharacterized protein n=1 Tax=Portunus trituberculatus TaxID=210409 RepID=A0A5B7JSI5_PORTR|nr:hypothetical protein [Portunus trituberculatus]
MHFFLSQPHLHITSHTSLHASSPHRSQSCHTPLHSATSSTILPHPFHSPTVPNQSLTGRYISALPRYPLVFTPSYFVTSLVRLATLKATSEDICFSVFAAVVVLVVMVQ